MPYDIENLKLDENKGYDKGYEKEYCPCKQHKPEKKHDCCCKFRPFCFEYVKMVPYCCKVICTPIMHKKGPGC